MARKCKFVHLLKARKTPKVFKKYVLLSINVLTSTAHNVKKESE